MITYSDGQFAHSKYNHIYYQSWLPQGEAKAVIVLSHGMSEHSGRYTELAEFLLSLGCAVYTWDHPGHGRSGGERKYIEQFSDFTDVMDQYIQQVRQQQPDLPMYIIAHSMGGLISTNYLLDHQEQFAGVILSGPAIKPADAVNPIITFIGKVLSVVWPKLSFSSLNGKYVCRDPKVLEHMHADPLSTHGKVAIRLLAEILVGMARVEKEAKSLTLPILILQGTEDRIVNPKGAKQLHDKVSSEDKTLILYQDFYHEVFNDLEKDRVFADVSQWLSAQLDSA